MQSGRRTRLLTYLLFFLSGISGLIYQIVWTRLLVLVFGNTLMATSTVLSSFMAGLAAGSFILGRWIDRRPRSLLTVYAVLEAGIGLFALVFPLLLDAATPLYMGLYRALAGDLLLLNLVRFAVCFVLIFIPTFLMGGTLPVLLKRFVGGEETIGGQTGLLYGLNTAGAVTGTLACGYLLLRTLGMQQTTWIAVGMNLGVALFAWLLGRGESTTVVGVEAPGVRVEPTVAASPHTPLTAKAVLIGIGISGFCALAYEVFWIRMLNLFVNNNVYSFTAILATFLTGIALGSLLYSSLLKRHRHPVRIFASLQLGIGLISFATPFIFSLLQEALFSRRSEVLTLAKTAVIMLGPTILMGIAVPLAVQICQRGARREGTSVGVVYAVNTIGAIFGALAAGFLLLPGVGLQRGLLVVASLNLLASLMAVITVTERRGRLVAAVASVALVVAAAAITPRTIFRSLYDNALPDAEILHYKEGKVANVVVYDMVMNGWKDLFLNGVEEASSRLWHVQLFKMLGILPPMVHPNPEDALMVAFGAGMSAGACVHQVGSLDCVDLNPDIHEVAAIFKRENLDVLSHPGFNLIENDGRNTLLLSDRPYSLIISDATNPKSFDSWTLYTREFYQLIQERLKPDGVFCQWVVIPLTGDSIKVLLNTFKSVFPHTSLWCIYGSTQCMMLATPDRLEIDFQRLADRLEPVLASSGFRDFGVPTVEKFLSFFFLGEDGLAEALKGFEVINTDDLPIAQFRVRSRAEGVLATTDLLRNQESIAGYLTNLPDDAEQRLARLDAYQEIARRLHWGFLLQSPEEFRAARRAAELLGMPDDANVASALRYDDERKRYFERRVASRPQDANAHNSLAEVHWLRGEHQAAIERLARAVELDPDFAVAHFNLGRVLRDAGQHDAATEKFVESRRLNPTSAFLVRSRRQLGILDLLRKLQFQPDDAALRNALLRAYLDNDEIWKAEEVARVSVALDPEDAETWRFLARLYKQADLVEPAVQASERYAELTPTNRQARGQAAALRHLIDDEEARREWLDRNRQLTVSDTQEPPPSAHPPICERAREAWNSAPFHGLISRDQLQKAVTLLTRTTEAEPGHLHAYLDAARIHEHLGDPARATDILQRGMDVSPGNASLRAALRRTELRRDLESGGVPETGRVRVLLEIGQLYGQAGEAERAIELFRRALEVEPSSAPAWASLAVAYDQTGRYELALGAFERALNLDLPAESADRLRRRLAEIRQLVEEQPAMSWESLVRSVVTADLQGD